MFRIGDTVQNIYTGEFGTILGLDTTPAGNQSYRVSVGGRVTWFVEGTVR